MVDREGAGKVRSDNDVPCLRCGRRYGEHYAYQAICPVSGVTTHFLSGSAISGGAADLDGSQSGPETHA